jgi:hypothetical protein
LANHEPFLPGLSPVGGKSVQIAFDGGRTDFGRWRERGCGGLAGPPLQHEA